MLGCDLIGNRLVSVVAEQQNITKPYTISLPQGEKGVYTH